MKTELLKLIEAESGTYQYILKQGDELHFFDVLNNKVRFEGTTFTTIKEKRKNAEYTYSDNKLTIIYYNHGGSWIPDKSVHERVGEFEASFKIQENHLKYTKENLEETLKNIMEICPEEFL